MIFALGVFVPRLSMSWNVSSLGAISIFLCFSVAFGLTTAVILFVSGVFLVWWLPYVMKLWLSIFSYSFVLRLSALAVSLGWSWSWMSLLTGGLLLLVLFCPIVL